MLLSEATEMGPAARPVVPVLLMRAPPLANPKPLRTKGSAPTLTPFTSSVAPEATVVPEAVSPKGLVLTAPVVRVPALTKIWPVKPE